MHLGKQRVCARYVFIIFKSTYFLLTVLLLVYALYNMSYSFGMLLGPLVAGVVMSEPVFQTNGFQVLMLIFAITILVTCPLMLSFK